MFFRRSIRTKLRIAIGILLVMVVTLVGGILFALQEYRNTIGEIADQSDAWPLVTEMNMQLSELRSIAGELHAFRQSRLFLGRRFGTAMDIPEFGESLAQKRFQSLVTSLVETQQKWETLQQQSLLNRSGGTGTEVNPPWDVTGHNPFFSQNTDEIQRGITRLRFQFDTNTDTISLKIDWNDVSDQLSALQLRMYQLSVQFQSMLEASVTRARRQARSLWIGAGVTSVFSLVLLVSLLRLASVWLMTPLGRLITGSRRIAAGEFNYRIELHSGDEMEELSGALNEMTERFDTIRHDLDDQVRKRTQEIIRVEHLASVGYLAAGVAHEINNPLASIAMCAESLQSRVPPQLDTTTIREEERLIILKYLQMIQDEAFRCKDITEKLLDFSRVSSHHRAETNLTELVADMIGMITQQPRFKGKTVRFEGSAPIMAVVHGQEIKQVVINLLVNSLDAVDVTGVVDVQLTADKNSVTLRVRDDGIGMDLETLQNVFEPFFTLRNSGHGSGLGLSITHRIITEHGGTISVHSDGLGRGAVFSIILPR